MACRYPRLGVRIGVGNRWGGQLVEAWGQLATFTVPPKWLAVQCAGPFQEQVQGQAGIKRPALKPKTLHWQA